MQNYEFVAIDLMPWYSARQKDFSLLEVNNKFLLHIDNDTLTFNRPLHDVRGFTRETLIAFATDIEMKQWCRGFNVMNGIPVEHPRSSTTDDVKCFFSVICDIVGKDFTLKQVR